MNACSRFVSAEGPDMEGLLDHVDHVVDLVGMDSLCLGLDLCDSLRREDKTSLPEAFDVVDGHRSLPLLASQMVRRGYGETDLEALFGANFHRFLKGALTP